MSKNEKIKEQIGWLKVVFGILSAILLSLSGWLATHYKSSDDISIMITTILIVCFSLAIVVVNKQAYKKIDELEEL
ncbi:hypothetical protein [Sulfurimonas sp.]|uniref:hypothetical protein n=1 Tax=Sulfurimonas sp. TaxID=2022749 RepID=UPI002B48330B|nr:hypothetical protein [Sulfurimonas sp.]